MTKLGSRMSRAAARMAASGAALMLAGALAPVAVAETSPITAAKDQLGDLAACVNSTRKLDVLLLLDETGSLIYKVGPTGINKDEPGSDADHYRVPAAKGFLKELLSRQQELGFTTNVRVAGFGQNYNGIPGSEKTYGSWTILDSKSIKGIDKVIDSAKDRTFEDYTNYANAFTGVMEDFGRSGEADACKLLVTFTDGALTAEGPNGKEQAQQALCEPNGIADDLRRAGIAHVGIGLSTPSHPSDFTLFKGITNGEGMTCGQDPANGAFFPADSVGSLFASFRQVLGTSGTKTAETSSDETFNFVLDDSIDSVRFTAIARDNLGENAYPVLTAPDGSQLEMRQIGSDQVAGAQVTWDSIASPVQQVDGTMVLPEGGSWAGEWKLQFAGVDPNVTGRVFNTVHIQPNLRVMVASPASPDGGTIQIRDDQQIQVSVINGKGVTHPLAGKAFLTANYLPADGSAPVPLTKDADISSGGPLALPLTNITEFPANGQIEATVTVTTAAAGTVPGTTLEPISTKAPVSISKIDTPSVSSNVAVKLNAPEVTVGIPVQGPGSLWVEPANVDVKSLPDGMSAVAVSSPHSSQDTALSLGSGEQGVLPVTLATDKLKDGLFVGAFDVTGTDAEGTSTAAYRVDVKGNVSVPVNKKTFALTFLLVLIGAILIPLFLLYVFRWFFAKLGPRSLSYTTVAGNLDLETGKIELERDWEPKQTTLAKDATINGKVLKLDQQSVVLEAWRIGPWSSPFAQVEEPLSVAYKHGATRRGAKLPLDLASTWFVSARRTPVQDKHGVPVFVTLIAPRFAPPDQIKNLSDEVERQRDSVGRELAKKIKAQKGWKAGTRENGQALTEEPDNPWETPPSTQKAGDASWG